MSVGTWQGHCRVPTHSKGFNSREGGCLSIMEKVAA